MMTEMQVEDFINEGLEEHKSLYKPHLDDLIDSDLEDNSQNPDATNQRY